MRSEVDRRSVLAALAGLGGAGLAAGCGLETPALGALDQALSGPGTVVYADTFADLANVAKTTTTVVVLKGMQSPGDLGGGVFFLETATTEWRRLPGGHVNVRWFGARADGGDDQPAFAAAIAAANAVGMPLYVPAGEYFLATPVVIHHRTPTPTDPTDHAFITRVYGDGPQSILRGAVTDQNRGLLEVLGDGHRLAVLVWLSDLRIEVTSGPATAYCLRFGDAAHAIVDRVEMAGPSCLALKCFYPGRGAAQIDTSIRSCRLTSTAPGGTAVTRDVALGASAPWDNVRFDSCWFVGRVQLYAVQCEFTNCTFSQWPAATDLVCVEIYIRSATFLQCRFLAHRIGILMNPQATGFDTWRTIVRNCQFDPSGTGLTSDCAILVGTTTGPAGKVGRLSVVDTTFNDAGYSIASICNGTGVTPLTSGSVLVDGCSNASNPAAPIRVVPETYSVLVNARTQLLGTRPQPESVERVRWTGSTADGQSPNYPKIANLDVHTQHLVARTAWVQKLTVFFESAPTATTAVALTRNGTVLTSKLITTGASAASLVFVWEEPWPGELLLVGQSIAARLEGGLPTGTAFVVEVELGS